MRSERMAASRQQAAAQAAASAGERTSSGQMQPGPSDMDNHFLQTGGRSVAALRNAPHYSFGNLSEMKAARYFPGMEVELVGRYARY